MSIITVLAKKYKVCSNMNDKPSRETSIRGAKLKNTNLNNIVTKDCNIDKEETTYTIVLEAMSRLQKDSDLNGISKWIGRKKNLERFEDVLLMEPIFEGHLIIPKELKSKSVKERYEYEGEYEEEEDLKEWFWGHFEYRDGRPILKGHICALLHDGGWAAKSSSDIKTALQNFLNEEKQWFASQGIKVNTKLKLKRASKKEADVYKKKLGYSPLRTSLNLTEEEAQLLSDIRYSGEPYEILEVEMEDLAMLIKEGLVKGQNGGYIVTTKGSEIEETI